MTVSVIMPCYIFNNELMQLTKNAIESVKSNAELIIVDNNSLIGGGYLRNEANIYIKNQENLGYPKAINQGIALSHGSILAIANNDIRVSANWQIVSQLILTGDPLIGSVHFRMIDYDQPMEYGNRLWVKGRERWCTASFFVIRRKAFIEYDVEYGLGGYDDWDFFHRLRHVNHWKTVYTTRACYQHKHSSTLKMLDDGKSRQLRDNTNRELFKQKHGQYAEEIWQKLYPDQMKQNYYAFFNII